MTANAKRKIGLSWVYTQVGQLPDGSVFRLHWGPSPTDFGDYKLIYKTAGGAYVRPLAKIHKVVKGVAFDAPQDALMISLGTELDQVLSLGTPTDEA